MNGKLLSIGETASILQISIDTLRRWDKKGILKPLRLTPTGHRKYREEDVYRLLTQNNLFGFARSWASSDTPIAIPKIYYCETRDVFQARLETFQIHLSKITRLESTYPLIVSIAGEIGNNSFDHNAGRWPDEPGIFFAYDTSQSQVVLADRGQGILTTLKRVEPELMSHDEALRIAFTEIISGRAPEARGNGLKFVRKYITQLSLDLVFQSGDATLHLQNGKPDLNIKKAIYFLRGCLAVINY